MTAIFFLIYPCLYSLLILNQHGDGVMYNTLFHEEGGNTINSIAMPCGLGGSENHSH